MIEKLHVLFWIFAIIVTIVHIYYLVSSVAYKGSLQQTLDHLQNVKRTWPINKTWLLFALLWSGVYLTW